MAEYTNDDIETYECQECFEHKYSDEDFDPVKVMHFLKELGEIMKENMDFHEMIKAEKEDEEDFITTMFQEVLNPTMFQEE